MKRYFFGAFIVILLGILPVYGGEQPFSSDEVVLPPSLADQHGRMHEIDAQLQTLLFAPDRQAGKIVHGLLERRGKAYLHAHSALVVADIQQMPTLIARFLALPRMREYSYPLLLCRKKENCSGLPRRPDQVTVLRLEALSVRSVRYANQSATVRRMVEGEL